MITFIKNMIGTPYDIHNRHGLSCWGLVSKYYQEIGVILKDYPVSSMTVRTITLAFTKAFMDGDHGFRMIDVPSNGDVIICRGGKQIHCGLWFDGKILHSSPSVHGVALQPLSDLKKIGFTKFEYWTYDKH